MVWHIDGHNWDPTWTDSQPQEEEPIADWQEEEKDEDKKGGVPGDEEWQEEEEKDWDKTGDVPGDGEGQEEEEEEQKDGGKEGGEEEDKGGGKPGDDMKEQEKAEGGGGSEVGKGPSQVPAGYRSMQDAVAQMTCEDGYVWEEWNGRWWVGLPPGLCLPTEETPMEHLPERTESKEPEIKTPLKRPAAHEPKAPKKGKKAKVEAEAGDIRWKPLTKSGYKDFVDSCNGCGDKVHDPPDPVRQPHHAPKTEPTVTWKPCTQRGIATFTSFFCQAASPENMKLPELVAYMHTVKDDWSLIPPEVPGHVVDVLKYMSFLDREWNVEGTKDFDYWIRLRSGVGEREGYTKMGNISTGDPSIDSCFEFSNFGGAIFWLV